MTRTTLAYCSLGRAASVERAAGQGACLVSCPLLQMLPPCPFSPRCPFPPCLTTAHIPQAQAHKHSAHPRVVRDPGPNAANAPVPPCPQLSPSVRWKENVRSRRKRTGADMLHDTCSHMLSSTTTTTAMLPDHLSCCVCAVCAVP